MKEFDVKTSKPVMVRVMRDSRDASRDYFLPKAEAESQYNKGELYYDVTNRCYIIKK